MKLHELTANETARHLRAHGLGLEIGPFVVSIRTTLPHLAAGIWRLYGDFPVRLDPEFADIHARIEPPRGLRRWILPEAQFIVDGSRSFEPFEPHMAVPYFEWGLNWCVSNQAHQYLILHAAALERDGRALLIAGRSGAGKSTLCAALACSGWRLLSDEMTMIDPRDGLIRGQARPICLKNESVEIIRRLVPDAYLSPLAYSSHRGAIAHMRPPRDSVLRVHEPAPPGRLLFVEYHAGVAAELTPVSKAQAMIRAAGHAFNYGILGQRGFDALAQSIDTLACFRFRYGQLSDAIELLAGEVSHGESPHSNHPAGSVLA